MLRGLNIKPVLDFCIDKVSCRSCKGTGKVSVNEGEHKANCYYCKGTGKVYPENNPSSLDWQKRYLWPKLQDEGFISEITLHEQKGCSVGIVSVHQVSPDGFCEPLAYAKGDDLAFVILEAVTILLKKRIEMV